MITLPFASKPTCAGSAFRFAAPRSIQLLRQRQLSPCLTLCSFALKLTSPVPSLCFIKLVIILNARLIFVKFGWYFGTSFMFLIDIIMSKIVEIR